MSEKEKKIMDKFSETIPKLKTSDQTYILGLAEGMALVSNKSSNDEDNECDKAV